jgi:hypothetical protein
MVLIGVFLRQTFKQWQLIQEGTQPFLIGDWLISYAGGFVRRGFFGWFLGIATSDAADALLLLYVIQTSLYVVIFAIVIVWAISLPAPANWAPMLLSPAFLVFSFNDFGGSHRKEIIVLAGLFLVAEAVRTSRLVTPALAVALLLFVVGVLSHEANTLLVVPFLLLIREASQEGLVGEPVAKRFALAMGTVAFLGFTASALASGDAAQRGAVCDDLVDRGFDARVCEGAISYLGESAGDQVLRVADTLPLGLLYVVVAAFASVPFLLSPWARERWRLLVVAVLPLAPLFVVALDWGRWIMLAVVIATVLTVVGSVRSESVPERLPLPLVLLFVNAWSLEHFNVSVNNIGQGKLLGDTVAVLASLRSLILG